ncbi:uncharacterized protein LOC112058049 isoform X1 [Bicyclus anynana]|uniref:Uncharacterized protein LOC112058049 isoform X1 n=1 Tax=Bicyclus anynana TaxID=110368 RepID=A0ABM3LXI4_BICAN|nr:uncharacterized protein LOC112058049 isoform X1 [Bicyclus anynana]
MWKSFLLTCMAIPWSIAQNGRSQRPFDNGHGWDIRLAVPGNPGNDYPTLDSIPRTSFTCSGKEPGYYADVETNCQVFRVCTLGSTYGFQSFICPNGTLFNQAVLVCDWWMKVNCKNSRELFKLNDEKFVNLKLGSQFMSDIKKMITHPIRNPYDDTYTKNNLIVMQEYKPPSNQLYNGATLSNFNRNSNNAYFQTNQAQRNTFQNAYSTANLISHTVSTPSTQQYSYIQNQKQSKPYVLPNRSGNTKNISPGLFLNSQPGQVPQPKSLDVIKYSQNTHSVRPTQVYQRSIQKSQNTKLQDKDDVRPTYKAPNQFNSSRISKSKEVEWGIEFSKQQLNRKIKQDKLISDKHTQASFVNIEQLGNRTKQTTVSNETPPAIITKTLAFRRIIKDSENGNPKSRITFKTWIVRPSRNSKLIVEPTPYTYNRPANFLGKIIADISNNNNLNTTSSPKVETETVEDSYVYNVPTAKINDQILSIPKETSEILPSSTSSSEVFTGYSLPTPPPTKPALLYLLPTTFKPSSRLYVPPAVKQNQISRQYLLPVIENSKLVAAASSPRPFLAINNNEPSFFLSKQTHVNTNQNNLAFSDILTKEKLDITVNDIVKDTNNVFDSASPEELQQFKQNINRVDYPIDNYLYSDKDSQSGEKLTLQPPPPLPKSSRLIVAPSIDLEPPIETSSTINQNTNPISNLPYYEESTRPPNTIERTVSLKITIPENIADLLFKNQSTNLEILSTGNSNNWLLSNKVAEDSGSVVPIGKLIWNKNSNISNSQDLVFSLLVDSINAAKDYNNIVQQNIATTQPTPTQSQFQSVKKEDLQRITNDISQLTSSQFSAINNSSKQKLANLRLPPPSVLKSQKTNANSKPGNSYSQNQREQKIQLHQDTQKQREIQTTSHPISGNNEVLDINSDNLYSGQLYQLPVPVVSKQIYNSLFPGTYKSSNNAIQSNLLRNSISVNDKIIDKSNADYELIQSHSIDQNSLQSSDANPRGSGRETDQGSTANAFIDALELPKNGITAQLQDNIVGTLPHPLDDDKLIKYKKDQTYYIYTHLNNDDDLNTNNQIQNVIRNNLANTEFTQNNQLSRLSAYELIPSLGYKLDDEREKQRLLNAFQINGYGKPKQVSSNENTNLIRRQDVISDVDFTVNHPKSSQINKPAFLYDGPNSYSAPQKSVGYLGSYQNNIQSITNFNSKIEKFDTDEDKNYGYPKISPVKRFLF